MSLPWIFLRHGESTANAARQLSGWVDVELTERGQEQARNAGIELANWALARVISSDLQRAYNTAALSLSVWEDKRKQRAPEVRTFSLLRERNLGDFQGQNLDTLRKNGENKLLLGWTSRPPQGESHADLAARALPLLAKLPVVDGPTLLVGHGGLLRTLLGLLDGVDTEEIGRNQIPNAQPIVRHLKANSWVELASIYGSPLCD